MEILSNNTPEKWEEIKTHPFYADELAALKKEAEDYLVTPVPATPYTAYLRFRKDGDRASYEKPYFARRRRLAVLALLTKLYGEKYLPALLDVIWAVTEEFTWCLPAHLDRYDEEGYRTYLDLFSTETGALLAETDHILGDVLPDETRVHIRAEVRTRVMASYIAGTGRSLWWREGGHNWGAVCTAGVALCFMYLGSEEEVYLLEPQFDRTMRLFLASYGTDGCCAEGLSYWHYGFGFFLTYADAMRNYSETHRMVSVNEGRAAYREKDASRDPVSGRIDYFLREDVKRAAGFSANMRLLGEHSVPFSDGPRNFSYARSLFWLLKREYPDDITYPPLSLVRPTYCNSGLSLSRCFLWSDPNAEYGEKIKNGTVHYPEASWFIKNTERYSFAAKAGHNAEPHNHNDVGSFHLVTKSGESFIDPGSGEYVRQYFRPDTRYGFIVNRTLGHSLPIINGNEQIVAEKGKAVSAPVSLMNEDSFAFDMANAYGIPTLTSAVRRFDTDEEGVTLTDTFVFSETPESVKERFVCVAPPEVGDGWVTVGGATLSYAPDILDLTLSEEDYKTHARQDATLYFADLTVKKPQKEMTLSFRIDVEK